MNPISALPAFTCLMLALATSSLLVKKFGKPLNHDRYASLDGLRGYLAFFVFLHHSSIWYFYLRSNEWKVPPSSLYTQFGQSSVALFFMITGFLFFSKLLDGRTKKLDWGKLFVSRFTRLVPLYLFAMLLLFSMVVIVSHGNLNEPILSLFKNTLKWVGFTALGGPDLNGVSRTFTIVAGVTWSLPYEWAFYFSLPILALTVGVRPPPMPYLFISAIAFIGLVWGHRGIYLLSFVGGIAAALLVRSSSFRQFATTRLASIISGSCLVTTVAYFPTAYSLLPMLLLSAAFIIIASGNTLGGVLAHPVSRMLGEMAYSIYLLHGLMLFAAFHVIIGTDKAAIYSPFEHWGIVACITPLLILGSFATFHLIENPAMRCTKSATAWIRYRVTSFAGRLEGSRTAG